MEIFGKWPFFRADMAGLGKYHMGRFGRIGVYRVKLNALSLLCEIYHLKERIPSFNLIYRVTCSDTRLQSNEG